MEFDPIMNFFCYPEINFYPMIDIFIPGNAPCRAMHKRGGIVTFKNNFIVTFSILTFP